MEIGAVIKSQYQVIEHIGRGGMADVWSARDQFLQRMVAIKTIGADLSPDTDSIALFEKEAQTIALLEHPHILPIYDFGNHEDSLFIVMRYMTGGSLEDVIGDGPMAPGEVLRVGQVIAEALDFAHAQGYIHLDLKPPNILMDSFETPYLADFGLATVLDPQGQARNPGSGTLLYMSPEQLVSETIDHRADIYAFSIMLFHMLTAKLPFDGLVPLALRQLQEGQGLPYLEAIDETIPPEVTEVLRQGTAQDAANRPDTHVQIMEALKAAFQPELGAMGYSEAELLGLTTSDEVYASGIDLVTEPRVAPQNEAVELFNRARLAWQGGQGRFLLGVTHFMLMSDYFQKQLSQPEDASVLELLDATGYQVLLRGAIEYDHQVDFWWGYVNDDDRRWVCLHALRSENAPARIRAMYRLETLPDKDEAPEIPRLVAQALRVERDEDAEIAALTVLGTRAKLVKQTSVKLVTQFQGRLLTTMTRLGIQQMKPSLWREVVYTQEIDTLVAEQAFNGSPHVEEFAARTVGQMRSLAAVKHIADAERENRPGALEALAIIRDEAASLPEVVTPQGRAYAWIANTARRLALNPLDTILRFVLALLGGSIGMGEYVYSTFRSEQLFTAQRWANTISVGLVFGLFIALTYLVSSEINRRLRVFWPWWMRLLVFGFLGYLMATLSYAGLTWLFYQYTPPWDLMRFVGAALALGLVLPTLLELRGIAGVAFTTLYAYAALHLAHRAYYHFDETSVLPLTLLAILSGTFIGWRASRISGVEPRIRLTQRAQWLLAGIIGLGVSSATWGFFLQGVRATQQEPFLTWDAVLLLFLLVLVASVIASYYFKGRSRLLFLGVGLITFGGFYILASPTPISSLAPTMVQPTPVLYYDDPNQVYTIALPLLFVVALGTQMQPLLLGWWERIGKPRTPKERGGWLTGMLLYTLVLTGLASVLALFSLKESLPWALGWSLWGFLTFVFALATLRWARWGVHGLLAMGALAVVGGFLFDALHIWNAIRTGSTPALWQFVPVQFSFFGLDVAWGVQPQVFWALWSIVVGGFVWGAQRRMLWGGLGILGMVVGWYLVAILTPIYGSMAVFMFTHYALLAYVLQPKYALMEANRWGNDQTDEPASSPAMVAVPPVPAATPEPDEAPPAPDAAEERLAASSETPADLPDIPPLNMEDLTATERRVLRPQPTPPTEPEVASRDEDELKTETRRLPSATPPTQADASRQVEDKLKTEPRKPSGTNPSAEGKPEEYRTQGATQLPKIKIDSRKVRTKPLSEADASNLDTERDPASTQKPDIKINTSRLQGDEADEGSDSSGEDED